MESYLFHLWEQRFLCPHSSIWMAQRHENKSFSDILVPNDPYHMALAPFHSKLLVTVSYVNNILRYKKASVYITALPLI